MILKDMSLGSGGDNDKTGNGRKHCRLLVVRPVREAVVDAQGQARGEEEDSGDEALPEPCLQRVLPLRRPRPRAEGDHHHHHRHGQGQAESQ